ncbi:MAG: hypothetical protein ACLSDW_07700 [Bifidobacterium longum]|nr:hypothetical protein [Bifidobacterium longum]
MALYTAGAVGVDIRPDTDNFWKILNAELHSRHPEVTVDVNTKGVARAKEQMRDLDGKTLTNVVKIDGDDSGLRKLRKEHERIQREWENKPIVSHFNIDDSSYGRDLDKLRDKNRKAAADVRKNWLDNTLGAIADIRQKQKKYEEEVDKLYRKRDKLLAKLEDGAKRSAKETKSLNEELANTSRQILDIEKKYDHTFKAIDLKRDKDLFDAQNVALFRREMDEAGGFVKNMQRNLKAARMESDKYKKSLDKTTKTHELLNKQLTVTGKKYLGLSGNASDASRIMAKQQATARELTSLFDEQEAQVKALATAFQKFKPMGIDKNLGKELNNTLDQLKKLRDFASRKPITAKATLNKTQWDKKYAELMYDAEKLRAKLDREHEVNVRVKVWENNADKLEKRLNRLRHTRLDIPVDWQVDQERIIASMRETAAKIKANPERRWELEADLDLQMRRAEEKLKKFEDKHDELKMDLDLETALARAHLAYFTRPRTVDIFANFKGTDLGKIFSGMTSGATGLKGVQNQFQNLVNLFDKLDKVVPKWSILGAGVTALGAGLLNLGRTVGGVGASLVSMSKAALAAPAALAGLASAGYVGYRVFGDLKEKFDVAKTSLANLNKELGDNAWNEYGDNLYRLANDVAPSLSKGLNGIAVEEGKVLNGLIDVVRQSNEADQLPRIFENTRLAVSELNPGLQSLARAFLGLGDQSSQYLPRMASYISDVAEKWANWVDTAERTGQVSKAMEKAIEQGGYLKSSVFDLIGVFEGTLGTLAKTENGIQGFSEALEKANKAVHTIKFQETLEAWSAGAQDAQDKMRNAFKDIGDAAYSLKDTTRAVFGDAGQIVGEGITGLSRVLQQSGGGIRDFSSGVRDGFSQVFDAVGDAGPMFSDLASMVGQLSRTFGGTFASALRTVSPLISTIAKGATGVAQAFDSLPGPVKSIITLWGTFGRAGKTAFESLKTGMLQNIQSTMRYQKMLSELGLSAEQASVKMGTLIKAMNQLRSGNYAGILSGAISEVNSLGMAAEANSKKLLLPGNAAKETSKDMGGLVGANGQAIASIRSAGEQAEQQSGRFGSLKTGVKNLWDAFGGWTTVAGLGISAGIAVIGNAISDYTTKAEASKQAMDKVIDGMKGIKSNAKEAADAFNDFKSETTKQWDDPSLLFGKDGGGAVTEWLVKVSGGYTSAADAAKRLGINTSTLTDAVSGNEAGYKKLVKQLEAQSKETYKASDQYGMMVEKQTDAAIAADTLLQALKKQHKEGLEKSVKEQMKYLRSLEQISDSSSALSDKLSSLATTVKANGQAFKENGELADANNAAYVRTDKAMKDVAATALLSAQQLLSYGEKNGQVEEYTQKAANSIYEAREAIVQQAQAAGMSEEAAERYADSLGLIPSDVGTTITAHSEIAQDAVDKLVQGISGLTDGEKEIVIRLREAGVVTTLDGVLSLVEQLMKGDLSERDLTLLLNAKGNARWETGEVKENLLALGMSKKAYKWLFSGEGNAEERMQKVRDELGYLNLTDEQIQWILDCIDHASGKIKDLEKNKVPAAKGVSFNIDANDDDAQVKLASYRESDGEKLAENNILVSAVDNTSEGTESAKANVFSVPHEWWSWLFGLDGTSGPSGIAKNAVESVPQQWQSILTGSGNTTLFSNIANNAVRNIPQQWLSMFTGLGNTPSFAGTARSLIGKVPTYHSTTLNAMGNALDVASNLLSTLRSIASRTWTAFIDTISGGGHHATGGRIYGPGTSTSDSIPAMLSNGEMVLRAAAVKKIDAVYGRSFLNTLNAVGSVEKAMQPSAFALNARRKSQAYATGGRVSTANGSWNVEVNPVIKVELPANTGNTTNNTVTINGVESSDRRIADAVETLVASATRKRNMRPR